MNQTQDPEMAALLKVQAAINDLTPMAKVRILTYLQIRAGEEMKDMEKKLEMNRIGSGN